MHSWKLLRMLYIAECAPELVSRIHSIATESTVKIWWSEPINSYSNQNMPADQYYVQYSIGSDMFLSETKESEFELCHLPSETFVLFSIRAEYEGKLGPCVFIGQSTSKFSLYSTFILS